MSDLNSIASSASHEILRRANAKPPAVRGFSDARNRLKTERLFSILRGLSARKA